MVTCNSCFYTGLTEYRGNRGGGVMASHTPLLTNFDKFSLKKGSFCEVSQTYVKFNSWLNSSRRSMENPDTLRFPDWSLVVIIYGGH